MADGESELEPQGASLTPDAAPPQDESAPTQPVETGGQPTPATEAAHSPPPGENDTPPKAVPRDEQGRFKQGVESDSVKDAVDRLAKPDPGKAKPAAKEPPAKATPTPKPQPTKVDPAAKAAKPDALKSDPLADLTPPDDEKAKWHPRTRERFDKVFERTREISTKLKEAEPAIAAGKEFHQLLDDYDIRQDIGFVPPEHLAGLVKVQAGVNRALIAAQQGRAPAPQDLQALTDLGSTIDSLRTQFGVQTAPSTPPAVEPFTGELPADLKELHDVYGVDEKRVRLLAALEASAKAPAKEPAKQAPPAQAAPVADQAASKPTGVDMNQIYSRRFMHELGVTGDQNPAQTMRVLLAHPATRNEVMQRFPGTTAADVPAVFDSLDPKERYEILKAAHRTTTKQVPAPRPPTPPPTQQRTHTGSAPPRKAAASGSGDAVDDAISVLARD
jgi:hypothetical protein